MKIGFPSGKLDSISLANAVDRNLTISTDAIEVTALRYHEYDAISSAMHRIAFADSCELSFHAPAQFNVWQERYLSYLLANKPMSHLPIVLHPDTITEYENWEPLRGRLRIENMELRKHFGTTVESLSEVFEKLPEARWCFDIGHARQVDETMTLAHSFLETHGDRLDEVHMSVVLPCGKHSALTEEAADDYRKVFRNSHRNFTVILETLLNEKSMKHDLDLARSIF